MAKLSGCDASPQSIAAAIKREIAGICGIKVSEVRAEHRMAEDLGMDSLDTVELWMAVEQECGVSVPEADADKLLTVKQVFDYVKEKRNGRK